MEPTSWEGKLEHALQVEILKELMRQLDDGENIDAGVQYRMPTNSCVCPEIAARERESFFRNHQQLIRLSGDLPEPGSYLALDVFGIPILATRDKSGAFHAFLNACRHRSVKVASETRGEKSVFPCPFHAWSYANTGDLLNIPDEDHFGAIDKFCHGLIELPAAERYGLLWVHLNVDGQLDIDELLSAELAAEFASYAITNHAFVGEKTMEIDLNWKFANDTFGETYHFRKLHKDTLGRLYYGNNLHLQESGRHHRFVTANRGIDAMRETPEALEAVESEQAAGRERSDVYDYEGRRGALGGVEASLEVFYSTVEREDYVMGEMQQRAAQTGILKEIIFGRNEPALHHFHRNYREALGQPPLEPVD